MAFCLNKNRSYLFTWPEKVLDADVYNRFQALLTQRTQGVPIAYLTGHREFWSLPLIVTPDTLIPRPETELLVEHALRLMPKLKNKIIVDLGTGSGAIALALASECPDGQFYGVDLSEKALLVALQNAQQLNLNNVTFFHGRWFDPLPDRKFAMIVSNPPYIDANDHHLQQGDVRFEPDSALIAEDGGMSAIKMITTQARQYLMDGGYLLLEHGYDQKNQVQQDFEIKGYQHIQTYCDALKQPRVTLGQWIKKEPQNAAR